MKGEINNNTIIVGDFNTPLTPMDRSTKQKINKETQTLNDTIDQLDLIDIYRTFHPKTMNFTFLPKWLFKEALLISEERKEAKSRGERERYTQLNAEFQKKARRDKKAFLN